VGRQFESDERRYNLNLDMFHNEKSIILKAAWKKTLKPPIAEKRLRTADVLRRSTLEI
jgi:hypothetical protein